MPTPNEIIRKTLKEGTMAVPDRGPGGYVTQCREALAALDQLIASEREAAADRVRKDKYIKTADDWVAMPEWAIEHVCAAILDGQSASPLQEGYKKRMTLAQACDAVINANQLQEARDRGERPRIVCLCGSTRFMEAFQAANLRETIAGRIVLSIGCNTKSDADLMVLGELTQEAKAALDELHKRKIDLADEIFVLNVGGYIGESTRSEIAYAEAHSKPVRYLVARAALAAEGKE
jgi:hypothetical protein